jgi:hypothetical protein
MNLEDLGWTANFNEFRKKLELTFGLPEDILKSAPDLYPHMVLSHGFMEYAGVTRQQEKTETRIKQERGSYDYHNPKDQKLYYQYLKQEYLTWAKSNKLEKDLLEAGWKEYLED